MTDFKTSDRDVKRAIRSWLHEDRHEDVSRIAGVVLDLAETTPQRRATWWPARRTPTMNRFIAIGFGAVAVVVAVFIGAQLLGSPGGGIGNPTSPSPEPSSGEPSPSQVGGLPPGAHMIVDGRGDDPANNIPPLTVTIPAPGWYGEVAGGTLVKNDNYDPPDGAGMIIFVQPEYTVYGDACHWMTTTPETPVTTAAEFADALSSQASRDASEPVDITVGGYAGKSITLVAPADADFSDCDPGYAGSWNCAGAPCGYHTGPGEIDTVYILDIDGSIMAWNTGYYAGTPAEDVAEMEAIVQSASFGE